MVEMPFVGGNRWALVDELVRMFDATVAAGAPRLVTLEAPSGWGKTRLLQEFYCRLAAQRQDDPRYWPPSILDAVAPGDRAALASPDGRRKRVHPEVFVPADGAVPSWFWWGISATARRGGAAVPALAGDLAQVDAHSAALEERWRQVSGRRERLSEFLGSAEVKGLGKAATKEALGAAGLSVPGLGLLVAAATFSRAQAQRWSRQRAAAELVDASGPGGDLVAPLAEQVGRFAASGIPVVLVVEDAHEADASLVDLVVRLLDERRGPVLIVATAWSGMLDEPDRPAHRLVAEVAGPSRTRWRTAELGALSAEDLDALAAALLPEADQVSREVLVERFTNPLALELVCSRRKVRRAVARQALTREVVAAIPQEVGALYRDMWVELPAEVRSALMLAVLASPRSVGSWVPQRCWDPEVAQHAAAALPWLAREAADLRDRLDGDATAYAWVRHVDAWLRRCHEPVQHEIAEAHAHDEFVDAEVAEFSAALAAGIDLDDEELPAQRRRQQAQLLVSLAARQLVSWDEATVAAADALIAEAAASPDVDSQAVVVAVGEAVPGGGDALADVRRRRRVAEARGTLGRADAAADELGDLLAQARQRLAAGHPESLTVWHEHALWLGRCGRLDEAVEQCQGLLEVRERVLGVEHPDTLRTRSLLASWLGRAGQAERAVGEFAALLEVRERVLGVEHPDALRTRSNLASWLGNAGHGEQALAQFRQLWADRGDALGPEHPETLRARSGVARWLGETGQVSEAVEAFTSLLAARTDVLGPGHPRTLRTRRDLAHWLGRSAGPTVAVTRLRDLLADQQEHLGAEHPETLACQHELLNWLDAAGESDKAARGRAELRATCERVLDEGHALLRAVRRV